MTTDALAITTWADGDGLAVWTVPMEVADVEANDQRGALGVSIVHGSLTFDRAPEPPLMLRYRVAAPENFREEIAFGPYAIHFDGRILLLPIDASSREVSLAIEGTESARAATTIGLGTHHTIHARPLDLRDVAFAIGPLEEAHFDVHEGRDVIASVGPRAYDLRWVGAEIALLRTRVNGYFGGVDSVLYTTLLIARPSGSGVPPFAVSRSGFGLRGFVREDAEWNAEARLAVTQILVRRWMNGVLRFGPPDDWWSFGFTRWIAAEILGDMGTLTAAERAADLTMLEGAIALAEESDRTLLESMARGALYAAALDARLRARREPVRLREIVLAMFAHAEDERIDPLPRSMFEDALRDTLGEPEVNRFRREVLGDARIETPRGAYGPCLVRRAVVHRPFALGFDMPLTHDGEFVLTGVIDGSPAHRAGLRDGTRVRDVMFVPGDPNSPITLTWMADLPRTVRYPAFDREARGFGWFRVRDVPEERCIERESSSR
jgi:hypothetical protein